MHVELATTRHGFLVIEIETSQVLVKIDSLEVVGLIGGDNK